MLAVQLERHDFRLEARSRLDPQRPLPRTLDNYSLRFAVTAR
jgi:hypothetical protein